MHVAWPAALVEPVGHDEQAAAEATPVAEYVPGAQLWHEFTSPAPSEYLPGPQVVQARLVVAEQAVEM